MVRSGRGQATQTQTHTILFACRLGESKSCCQSHLPKAACDLLRFPPFCLEPWPQIDRAAAHPAEGKLNFARRFEAPKVRDNASQELNKMMAKLQTAQT